MKSFYLLDFLSLGVTSTNLLSNPRIFSRYILSKRLKIATVVVSVVTATGIYGSYKVMKLIENLPVGAPTD